DREAPYIMKNGGYYYLFSNRGSCCNGLNSSYYVVVSRSTNIRGPYSGERSFIPVRNGNIIGPGHIGYGHGRLTYHYYDGNQNGAAKLMTRADFGFSNGWPYLGARPGGQGTVYQFRNRGTGLYIDGMGSTNNGDAVGQYANTTHPNSQWEVIDAGDGYSQLRNRGTGLFLDGYGRTDNGADVSQYANTTHPNSHWRLQPYGDYYRLQNRGTGLYLDGMGRTANGDAVGQYANTTHPNAQWQLVGVSASFRTAEASEVVSPEQARLSPAMSIYPNPVRESLQIRLMEREATGPARLFSVAGQLVVEKVLQYGTNQLDMSSYPSGVYFLEVPLNTGTERSKIIKE
ncbi:MAG: RICIN domain-containing protein, partial [Lewinella sp.]